MTLLAAARHDGQIAIRLNLNHQPVLFHSVRIPLAVRLGRHRLGSGAGVDTVFRGRINDAIAGSVHSSGPAAWTASQLFDSPNIVFGATDTINTTFWHYLGPLPGRRVPAFRPMWPSRG